ncbi:MAG: hypothetical protein AB4911_22210 [Oscillochloridaceae bacterium umkhey_bin13]
MTHFLVWYDPDVRRSLAEKVEDARDAYARRFSVTPNLVLLSEGLALVLQDAEVRSTRTVRPDHVWVGRSDDSTVLAEAKGLNHE